MSLRNLDAIDVSRTHQHARPLAPRRGLPHAFERHLVSRASTPGVLAEGIGDLVGTCRVRLPRRRGGPRWSATIHRVDLTWVRIAYVGTTGPWTLDVATAADRQTIVLPTEGRLAITTGDTTLDLGSSDAVCLRRDAPARLRQDEGGPLLVLVIDGDGLRQGLDALLGRTFVEQVHFEPAMDLADTTTERWQTALALLHSEVALLEPGHEVGVGLQPLESLLLTTLLVTQPSTCTPELHRAPALRRNRTVRRAVDHLEANLRDDVRVAEVAAAAGVTERTVQRAFRETLDQTPLQYLRDRRLEEARNQLLRLDAGSGTTIADVAHDWAFTNPGRFAAAYRHRFGETPAATLRR